MLQLQNLKHVVLFEPAAYTNNATGCIGTVDTLGYSEVLISVTLGTAVASDFTNVPDAFKIGDCDTSNGTFTDITVTVGETAWTVPDVNSSTPSIVSFHLLNLGQYERYLKLTVTPQTTLGIAATALLSRAGELPNTSTEQNLAVAQVNA